MSGARFVIIGAGVSGLAAAHRLTELSKEKNVPIELVVLEASSHAGGVISSRARDGFQWEEGPDSFITEKPWALDLCKRLGLEAELVGTNSAFQRSFVAYGGRLHPTPEGFYLLAPSRFGPLVTTGLFSWMGKLRMALEFLIPPRRGGGDESLGSFVRRRLGKECLERMAQPMVAGVYAADPETLSLRATFPRFLEMEAKHGSVVLALWRQRRRAGLPGKGVSGPRYSLFVTLKRGLSSLVETLVAALPAGSLRLETDARSLEKKGGRWAVTLSSGEVLEADGVCLALPGPKAAGFLKEFSEPLSAELGAIPYGSSATVHLAYRRADVGHALDGFGFVVPAVEKRSITGCTFTSVKFPGRAPDGHVLLRVFVGANQPVNDVELLGNVRQDLHELLSITGEPLWTSVKRHPASMPQYTLGHLERVERIEDEMKKIPGLALAGNACRGIGLPDCVRSGERAAENLWETLVRT